MPPFTIATDTRSGVIHASAYDYWSEEALKSFRDRLTQEKAQMQQSGVTPLLLIDSRRHGVQSKAVVQGLQDFAGSAQGRSTRTAVIVESALYRMQASRIRLNEHHRIFCDEGEARSWLLSAD